MDGAFNLRPRKRKPTINITSLIDVMFLLLIFFMVSSTFRNQIGIDVKLPEAKSASEQKVKSYEITVDKTGEFYFGEQRVDEVGLRIAIVNTLEADPEAPIILRADEQADFGKVIKVIDIAREVGTERLVIPTRITDEMSQ